MGFNPKQWNKNPKLFCNRYSVKYHMSDLPNEMKEEANTVMDSIYGQAATILVFVLLLYVVLLKGHVIGKGSELREVTFAWFFKNDVLEDIWDYLLENLIIAGIFTVILWLVRIWKRGRWITENHSMWLQGKWLHIHEKNNNTVRVGYVDILQNYDGISADCRNYDVEDIKNEDKVTNWHYINAQVNKDGDKSFMLQGFYSATKSETGERNSGMHTLSIINNGENPPIEMAGYFGDVNTLVKDTAASSRDNYLSCGRIRMYRMTKEQEENLFENGTFLPEQLKLMLDGNAEWVTETASRRYTDAVRSAVNRADEKLNKKTP